MEVMYSAGMVSHSTWNTEFILYMELLKNGKNHEEIANDSAHNNIFLSSSSARAKRMCSVLRKRTSCLSYHTIERFDRLDLSEKKLVNLISIMKTEPIFKEFMQEIYQEKLYLPDPRLTPYDFMLYFKLKSHQSQRVKAWTDETIRRLTGTFKVILVDTETAVAHGEDRIIKLPRITQELKNTLPEEDYPFLLVLGGTQ